jgi:hypothetical protein
LNVYPGSNLPDVYITGQTKSINFPGVDGFAQPALSGDSDAFVTKIDYFGMSTTYSTYLGGTGNEAGNAITVTNGEAYITGFTSSNNFVPMNIPACDNTLDGTQDAFVTKVNQEGTNWVSSTYLGGDLAEEGFAIALAYDNIAVVTGLTKSTNFPTFNSHQASLQGTTDAFLTWYNVAGSAHVYSSYLGGNGVDKGRSISAGPTEVFVAGETSSTDLPHRRAGAYQFSLSLGGDGTGIDGFVYKHGWGA